ncbi:malate dehydrogenase, mitochondrial [Drosophila sechellia]|uniref:Malate dehydrogenase, mitochondrial n=3 Tax=melanogaster subgroup TaxID=32351 RepID=Q9VEB1_DROME|nr:malate dehydrogenase 2 [Drosophila melanogaster]XP_002040995.1 malate dehydrogenase, mitochondrial [Drosophila sechellia]XP_016034192.1 malate dehydrogenase, mitochondrial [Drosophila simulans]XP_033165952.1 malate dehydrogenase, mitochondrial [Drosophila mauritiana]XP_039491421.1 malate dehydrogenase, mitochondrial [Drosophila santomea]XP_043651368.1 malate dehydrogenase, mitochondrial [Drosophila teissieri]ACL92766.1 CG7998-PA [synthetic construct]AAF55516.1 malate dehydrogenase 2 [Dros|eukprot:NP_650696.1 malate dehydrogenase 2 [Drosophila melanogaster]
MLKQVTKQLALQGVRTFSVGQQNNYKVTVCGAAGGIGQPLSLLLKQNPLVTDLALYDIVHTPGVAADLSHIDTKSKTAGFIGADQLGDSLKGSDVVVIPAGVPRKPGMTRDDLFNVNAGIIKDISNSIAKNCPKALVAIITNPVNTCVPIAAEILKKAGVYDPKRLFGVSTLDVVRARAFIGHALGVDPQTVQIPVIGGHSGVTILPVLSQSQPLFKGNQDTIEKLTVRIQEAGTEVVKAKAGAGSATLSMAYAGARFAGSLLKGLNGEKNVIECSYVQSTVTEATFFSTPLVLGKNGVQENLGLPKLNDYEKKLLEAAIPELKKNIQKGIDFANA